jgi:hypothetical protein
MPRTCDFSHSGDRPLESILAPSGPFWRAGYLKEHTMTQRANNGRRNASLDNKKQRAAGRQQNDPARAAIADQFAERPAKGKTGGADGPRGRKR